MPHTRSCLPRCCMLLASTVMYLPPLPSCGILGVAPGVSPPLIATSDREPASCMFLRAGEQSCSCITCVLAKRSSALEYNMLSSADAGSMWRASGRSKASLYILISMRYCFICRKHEKGRPSCAARSRQWSCSCLAVWRGCRPWPSLCGARSCRNDWRPNRSPRNMYTLCRGWAT